MARRRGRDEGSLYYDKKRERWIAALVVYDEDNHRRRKTHSFVTRKEGQTWLVEERGRNKQAVASRTRDRKVSEYLQEWLESRVSLKENTRQNYHHLIARHINPALGDIMLSKLTAERVQRLYLDKAKQSAHLARECHKVLHAALSRAVRLRLVSWNVTQGLELPKYAPKPYTVLDLEQANILIKAVREAEDEWSRRAQPAYTRYLETLIIVALTTGMREGELVALRWSDIDFGAMTVTVARTASRIVGEGIIETAPKTKASKGVIALAGPAVDALRKHLDVAEPNERGLVFSRNGKHFPVTTLRLNFYEVLDRAGLPRMRFHDLRHSTASILHALGVDMKDIQTILRHASYRITADIYTTVSVEQQRPAMKEWDALGQGE